MAMFFRVAGGAARALAIAAMLITAAPTRAATLNVNVAGGSDANDGSTPALAMATIQAAIAAASAPSTIQVAAGE